MAARGIFWLGLLLGFVFVLIAAVVKERAEKVMWLVFGGQAVLVAVTSAVLLRQNTGSRNQSDDTHSADHGITDHDRDARKIIRKIYSR